MSYIVRQKIKGRIYLYEATSYWDKDKKQNRQKRKYLGPEDAQNSIDVGQYSDKDAIGIIKNKNKIRNNKIKQFQIYKLDNWFFRGSRMQ